MPRVPFPPLRSPRTAPAVPAGRPSRWRGRLVAALTLLVALAAPAALAQDALDLDAEGVLERLQQRAEALQDATFLLTGRIVDPDGTEIPLEIEVAIIPEARAASAYFIQPDALADNQIVWDDEAVFNYVYLTNQVTVFDAGDPDALGGLLAERASDTDPSEFDLSLDLAEVFDGYDVTLLDTVDTPAGPAYRLRFDNIETEANIAYVIADVVAGEWYPYVVEFFQPGDRPLATLVIEEFTADTGLERGEVTYLPDDAEVFDERGN